ncbi:YbhN family protein [Nocardioides sp. NPDC000445]|uniref:lysylphosphatidylglycerol synthase transmembrane domain-containing protein n=1 Tax=Nocardioides sp. NPDC000445 TaxID=3154257 RepID=UPI00332E5694
MHRESSSGGTDRAGRERGPAAPLWSWLRRVGLLLVTVVAIEYVAVDLITGARQSWTSVGTAAPLVLVLAFALEAASFGCYSGLTHALLPPATRPPYLTVLAIDVTGNGFSHVVPGGGAVAAALRFRLLSRAKVPAADAVATGAVQYAVTVLWLVAAFILGLITAVPLPGTHPFLKTAAILTVVLVVTFGGLVAVLMVRPDQVVTVTHTLARRLPLIHPTAFERLVRAIIDQVHLVLGSRAQGRRTLLWGLGYWSFDAASLYLSVLAFGDAPNLGGLIATYALVSLLALLPITPGGLGLVEGVAVPVLVSFGTIQDAALLGVLTWRLFGFWLPVPVAGATYLWLRVRVLPRMSRDHGPG